MTSVISVHIGKMINEYNNSPERKERKEIKERKENVFVLNEKKGIIETKKNINKTDENFIIFQWPWII